MQCELCHKDTSSLTYYVREHVWFADDLRGWFCDACWRFDSASIAMAECENDMSENNDMSESPTT